MAQNTPPRRRKDGPSIADMISTFRKDESRYGTTSLASLLQTVDILARAIFEKANDPSVMRFFSIYWLGCRPSAPPSPATKFWWQDGTRAGHSPGQQSQAAFVASGLVGSGATLHQANSTGTAALSKAGPLTHDTAAAADQSKPGTNPGLGEFCWQPSIAKTESTHTRLSLSFIAVTTLLQV